MYSRVYVEITNICNKSCSFCHGTRRPKRQMSISEFREIADKLRPVTNYLYFHLMGEPLCHPELPSFIAYAASLGFKCAVTTNGTLLKKRAKELIDSGVYKVNISLHSFEGEGECGKHSYINDCLDFADTASKSEVLTVLRLWNGDEGGGKNTDTLALIKERFPNDEWVHGARGARIRNKLHLEYGERFDWPDIDLPVIGNNVFCYGLSDHFGVLSDGTVVPCCLDGDGIIRLGNIFSEDIEKILSSPRADTMRCGFKAHRAEEELCRRCGYARRFKI